MKFRKLFILLMMSLLLVACGKSDNSVNTGNEEEVNAAETSGGKKVGVIQIADHIALERARKGFEDELKKINPDVEIISKNANGDLTVVPSIIKSFQDKKVDLIYAIATPAAQGAKNGEKEIPIIFNAVTDPASAAFFSSSTWNFELASFVENITPMFLMSGKMLIISSS